MLQGIPLCIILEFPVNDKISISGSSGQNCILEMLSTRPIEKLLSMACIKIGKLDFNLKVEVGAM